MTKHFRGFALASPESVDTFLRAQVICTFVCISRKVRSARGILKVFHRGIVKVLAFSLIRNLIYIHV